MSADLAARTLTGVTELDRVLGDGLVPGAVVLLAGEPGVGKSTLLLEVAARWAKAGRRTLYVSGEESAAQVRLRAGRTDALADQLYLAAETDLGTVLGHIEEVQPSLMVVDSVQTVGTAEADGSPGGVDPGPGGDRGPGPGGQAARHGGDHRRARHQGRRRSPGRGCWSTWSTWCSPSRAIGTPGFRMVRATKNRFGPADEVGCFEMAEQRHRRGAGSVRTVHLRHAEPVPGHLRSP